MNLLTKLPSRMALMAVITVAALLTGCLESASESASNENSFPQTDGTGAQFSGSGSGSGGSNAPSDASKIRVSVQVPAGIVDGEGGRRHLLTTANAQLSVKRVGSSRDSVPDHRINSDNDDFIISFTGRERAPSDIDLVISATVNGYTFTAPLAAASRHVKLNPFTDYLVQNVIKQLSGSQIRDLKSCEHNLCTQALIWSPLVDQVQNYEIDIPEDSSPQQSRNLLAGRADFADFVEQSRTALTLDQDRIGGLEGSIDTNTTNFNTVYFGASLNMDQNQNLPFWASRTITRGDSVSNGGVGFAYPSLTLTSFAVEFLDLNITSLASDVPYIRNSASFSDLDGITNTLSTSPGPAFIRDEQSLIASRPALQSITQAGDTTTGWAPDPHFLTAYILGNKDNPTALLSSYFHAGKTLSLRETPQGRYERTETIERQATSTLELNFPQWEEDRNNGFEPKSGYHLIGFELFPGQNTSSAPLVRASFGNWDFDQATTNEAQETESTVWELSQSGVTSPNSPYGGSTPEITPHYYRGSSADTPSLKGHAFLNYPNIDIDGAGVDEGGPDGNIPNGAITPDNQWMAFSARTNNRTNNTDTGDFIRIAHDASSGASITEGDKFRVQGFSVMLTSDNQGGNVDQLKQITESCIEAGKNNTTFHEQGVSVSYNQANGTYREPFQFPEESEPIELDPIGPGNDFSIGTTSGDVQFRGFVADEGNTLVMLKKTPQSLGILLGFREDNPPGCPSN